MTPGPGRVEISNLGTPLDLGGGSPMGGSSSSKTGENELVDVEGPDEELGLRDGESCLETRVLPREMIEASSAVSGSWSRGGVGREGIERED